MTQFTQTYPTDLQYAEWLVIVQFFPTPKRGRPRKWELWQIINAILYVTRTGCQWRMLPKDMSPWQTVLWLFLALDQERPLGDDQCHLGSPSAPETRA